MDPHAASPALVAGVPLADATFVVVMMHGRGDSPRGLLPLARAVGALDGAVIIPHAAGNSWYPNRFRDPVATNEPWLTSALASMDRAVQMAIDADIPPHRIVLTGFSQGACLALEYAWRTPRRYGAVAALAGALIGEVRTVRRAAHSLDATPVLLACGDADAHIPESHVRDSAESMMVSGGLVDLRIYSGVGHTIVADQIEALRMLVDGVRASHRDDRIG